MPYGFDPEAPKLLPHRLDPVFVTRGKTLYIYSCARWNSCEVGPAEFLPYLIALVLVYKHLIRACPFRARLAWHGKAGDSPLNRKQPWYRGPIAKKSRKGTLAQQLKHRGGRQPICRIWTLRLFSTPKDDPNQSNPAPTCKAVLVPGGSKRVIESFACAIPIVGLGRLAAPFAVFQTNR
jgi:hypothetical protein